jgi:hypothetical protein
MKGAVERTITWYKQYYERGFAMSDHNIADYEAMVKR